MVAAGIKDVLETALCSHGERLPLLVAHRGGRNERDENTMGAFKTCYQNGLLGYETDFQLTADNQLVILHDDTLDRTTDGTGPLPTKTAAEIRLVRSKKSGEPLPFIEDFVAYFKDKRALHFELEMKASNPDLYPDDRLEFFCNLLYAGAQGLPKGTTTFSSFDERVLQTMRRLHPDARLSLIVGQPLTSEIILRAKELQVQVIDPVMNGTSRKLVREAQEAGFKLTGWPTLTREDYALGVVMGYDYLTTDIPVQLNAWIQETQARVKP